MRLLDPAAMGRFRVMAFGRDWPTGPPLAAFAYRLPERSRASRPSDSLGTAVGPHRIRAMYLLPPIRGGVQASRRSGTT